MEFETNHYVPSRLSLWCPVCGAAESKGCVPVNGEDKLRFTSHNAYATGTVRRPPAPVEDVASPEPQRLPANKPRWAAQRTKSGLTIN